MSRGRKTVPEGKGPAPQKEQGTVDKSRLMEMFRELKEDINSRFIEMKKDLEESTRDVSMDCSNSCRTSLLKRAKKERRLTSVKKTPS